MLQYPHLKTTLFNRTICLLRNGVIACLIGCVFNFAITQAIAQAALDSSAAQASDPIQEKPINYNEISLYLPILADQHKRLLSQLRVALDQARLTVIKIRTAENWLQYQQAIRAGKRGVFFTAPHYAAWSLHENQFRPLLRLNKPIKYVIAVERAKDNFFEINDLANSQICTQRALNLDYLLVNNAFQNRLLSATQKTVWSVTQAMQDEQSECDAYSISDHIFAQFERDQPNKFIRLKQGKTFNNYAFIAHPRISSRIRNKLSAFLLADKNLELLTPLYEMYAEQSTLIPANKDDYPPSYLDTLRPYW